MRGAQASAPHITSRPTDPVPAPALDAALDTLDLACLDADGSPAAGYPFTVTLSSGPVITGTLNSAGTARLENLTPGTAAVRFGKTEPETRVIRNQIHTLLKDIIKAEQREAQAIEARLSKKGVLGKAVEYNQAKNRGAWHAITQFLSFVNETAEYVLPQNKIQRALTAAWETWRYSDEDAYLQEFVSRFNDAEFKELADVIGFDPRSITREQLAEVKVMANFVWEDSETQEMLLAFAKDYIAAQHSLEMVEGAASLVMDVAIGILISALTLGAGGALIGAAKNLRHVNLLRPLGEKLKQLAQARKLAKGKKEAITSTSSVVKERLDAPKNLSKKGGDGDTIKPGKDAPGKINLRKLSNDELLAALKQRQVAANGKVQHAVLAEKFTNDVPIPVKSHRLIEKEGVWYTQTANGKLWRAKGNYDFVTINGHTYVAPSGKGHFNISSGATKVDYAGEIKFGYSSGTRGKISSWNNSSGHYTPSALNAWQARLPLEYFKLH